MRWAPAIPGIIGGVIVVAMVASCQSPTQIVLTVRTDVPCKDVQGSSVTVGRLGDIEKKPLATDALMCDGVDGNGYFGSVVLVPGGETDGEVAMKIVTGVGKPADECFPENGKYGLGCIVARRALRFIPHETLRVNVITRSVCNGVFCEETQTCVKGGCTTAIIPDPAACSSGEGCSEDVFPPGQPGSVPVGPDGPDGGVGVGVDGSLPDGAPCVPRTQCNGAICPIGDGCGGTLSCGSVCPGGQACDSTGQCVVAPACIQVGGSGCPATPCCTVPSGQPALTCAGGFCKVTQGS